MPNVNDRCAHNLKGESLPIQRKTILCRKLRKDASFWSLAKQVSQQLKSEKKP